jgi:hypothetical protein
MKARFCRAFIMSGIPVDKDEALLPWPKAQPAEL